MIVGSFFTAPKWILYMMLLTISLPDQEVSEIFIRFNVNNKLSAMITKIRSSYQILDIQLAKVMKDSQLFKILKNYSDNELGTFLCLFSINSRKKILRYLNNLKCTSLHLSGLEISNVTGLHKRELGRCIESLKMLKLDKQILNRDDEIEMLKTICKENTFEKE
jgi:hypothetical protein